MLTHVHTHTPSTSHTMIIIAAPQWKKKKTDKKTKAEKAIEKAFDSFMNHQKEAGERFQKYEDERWKKETELEERRRREDRKHEFRVLQLLGLVFQRESYDYNTAGQYNYEY